MCKLFYIALFFIPTFAIADIDVSNCEVIGYRISHITEKNCTTMEKCQQSFEKIKKVGSASDAQEFFDRCVESIKTAEECAQYIAEQHELSRKEFLIYKCPMTDFLLKQKIDAMRTSGGLEKYSYLNDGTLINTNAMIADSEYAYLFRDTYGLNFGGITPNSKFGYSIIGPADESGLMFVWIENQ